MKKISFEIIAGGSFAKRCYLYLPLKSWGASIKYVLVLGEGGGCSKAYTVNKLM